MATIYDAEAVSVAQAGGGSAADLKQFRNRLFKQAAGLEEALAVLPWSNRRFSGAVAGRGADVA